MDSDISQVATSSALTARQNRQYHLDWLRVLAMLMIFFTHTSRFFDFGSWQVKSIETSLGAEIFNEFTHWLMPLFFVLAGASIYYALKFRTAGGFAKERTLRILIPILIIGFFVIAPPQVYLERLTSGDFSGNFFQFYYPHYFDGFYGLGGNFAIVPMHMWFLLLLFIYSLILLPLFLPNKETGRSLGTKLATLFENPWTLIVPVLLLAVFEVLLHPLGDLLSWGGGWNHVSYLLFFFSGYLIFSNVRIQENIKKYAKIALIAALVFQVFFDIMWFAIKPEMPDGTAIYLGIWILYALRCWFFIFAILGFGSRYLNFNNRFLGYANEAVLPFYILHQTVILIIGFFVLQWNMGIAPKYFIIATSSFIGIMFIYEILVRRINMLRFLFGMRLKRKSKLTQT
ncbi:MAG: acyltransferase family protein [Dehalococcoidia bacterium]|nr:MAG: acyltransferase family protein [Dehalococcoidia bacterium]